MLALLATGFCLPVTQLLVAAVTNSAFIAKLANAEGAGFAERNNEHTGIAAFIFAVLVPAYVILFVFVADEREVIHRLTHEPAQFLGQGFNFSRCFVKRRHPLVRFFIF